MTVSAVPLGGIVRLGSGFLAIAVGSALFSHAAERLIHRLFTNRQMGARILGNVSLSLPEAILPVFAFLSSRRHPGTGTDRFLDIGVGAILGAPAFLLLVLWPLYLWATRKQHIPASRRRQLVREPPILMAALAGALALGFLPVPGIRIAGGIVLLALYLFLVLRIEPTADEADALPGGDPVRSSDVFAFLAGTGLVLVGPELFLSGLGELSGPGPSATPFLLSLVLSPLATESPEMMALVFFLRRRERVLGFDIVWGSISFQLTVSLSVGLFLSPWTLAARHAVLGGILVAILFLSTLLGRKRSRDV